MNNLLNKNSDSTITKHNEKKIQKLQQHKKMWKKQKQGREAEAK